MLAADYMGGLVQTTEYIIHTQVSVSFVKLNILIEFYASVLESSIYHSLTKKQI